MIRFRNLYVIYTEQTMIYKYLHLSLFAIFTFIFIHCQKNEISNVCEPGSKAFYETILFKLGVGDFSTHCGFTTRLRVERTACNLSQTEVMQPANWPLVKAELEKQAALGTIEGSISYIPTTGTGSPKWGAATLANNGKLYSMPYSMTTILQIDPTTDSVREISVPGTITGSHVSGVLALNGKIYSIPYGSDSIIIFDPVTESISSIASPIIGFDKKYFGGVLAPNGKIYAPPAAENAGHTSAILVIDPSKDTAYTLPSPATGSFKWISGVLAPNGKIYGSPGSQDSILVIDPTNDSVSILPISKTGAIKYGGFTLGIDGKLYGTPLISNSEILEFDPFTNAINFLPANNSSSSGAWIGGALAPNGNIFHTPYSLNNILQTNTSTKVSGEITQSITGNEKWSKFRLARNGKLYSAPGSITDVLVYNPGSKGTFCDSILFSSYLNH